MRNIISLEELEEDLQEKQDRKDRILSSLASLFDDAGFTKKDDKKNNISFEDTNKDIKALFSIYDTTFNYSAYITVEGDNSFTYSAKGDIDGIEEAAEKFLAEYNDLLTLDISFDTPAEDEEVIEDDEVIPGD